MQFTKLIIVITIAVLAIGCGTNRAISYGADIGDSILIYIPNYSSDVKENYQNAYMCVYYNYFDFTYLYGIKGDSLYTSDEFDIYDPYPIKKTKNRIVIQKKDPNAILFRINDLDSIVLRKITKSYIDKREKRKYIVKSHFYENVIRWNKNHNKHTKNKN